jgi:site-specific recombinase XerD
MATFSIFIKGGFTAPKVNNKGESLIYWKYVHDERSILFSTKCFAQPSQLNWIERKGKRLIDRFEPILKSASAYSGKNKNIKSQFVSFETIVEDIKREGLEPTIDRVKDRTAKKKLSKNDTDFVVFAEEIEEELFNNGMIRRARKYSGVANKVMLLLKLKSLDLRDLTREMLVKYKSAARNEKDNKSSTIVADLKVIRSTLKKAIEKNRIKLMPSFKGLIVESESKGKEGLSWEQLKKLEQCKLLEDSFEFHSRNIWIFSYMYAGIRIGDLLQLSWKNVEGNRLQYTMAKTKNNDRPIISLKLNDLSQEILSFYRGTDPLSSNKLIFPFLSDDISNLVLKYPIDERDGVDPKIIEKILKHISAKTTLINKSLKKISRSLGFESVNLTTHIARHTFSQHAIDSGSSMENLAKMLNHAKTKTTEGYSGVTGNSHIDSLHGAVISRIAANLRGD